VDDLHSDNNKLSKENSLTEKGAPVNGRGDQPNTHDILTGSTLDGRVQAGDGDSTCSSWTSNSATGSALLGHHDRQGGGANARLRSGQPARHRRRGSVLLLRGVTHRIDR
jgi:hypothetical protein